MFSALLYVTCSFVLLKNTILPVAFPEHVTLRTQVKWASRGMWHDKSKDARPCGWAKGRFFLRPVRTPVRILRTSDARDCPCATQPLRRSVKHKAGEIDQSHSQAQFPFEQRVWYYRLRPAQRTQRRLPDQLWTSIARCPYLLFFFSSSTAASGFSIPLVAFLLWLRGIRLLVLALS